jgi:hypothetical protein
MCFNIGTMLQKFISAIFCLALPAAAASPSASVVSTDSFVLNGVDVPSTAAASTLVHPSDHLAALEWPVVLRLDDCGALVTVDPHSSIEIGESGGKLFIRLTAGSLQYKRSPDCSLLIFKRQEAIKTALSGIVKIGSHTTAIVAASAGGGAAVATTGALAKRSKTCPDGQPKTKDCGNQ